MRIIEESPKYNKEIIIELNLAELVMLMSLSGATNSDILAKEVITNGHPVLAKEIRENTLNRKLYEDLEKIHKKFFN